MEDLNMIAADCIVICCCCECMILQIIIILLLKLPLKLLKKAREYAKKLRARKRGPGIVEVDMTGYGEDSFTSLGDSFRIGVEDSYLVESPRFGCCMHEIETVLDEFSSRGEFAFGSFWGGEVSSSSSRSFRYCFKEEQVDHDGVQYRLIEFSYH